MSVMDRVRWPGARGTLARLLRGRLTSTIPAFALALATASGATPDAEVVPRTAVAGESRPEAHIDAPLAPVDGARQPVASLFKFNTATVQARLVRRECFSPVFVGIKEQDGLVSERMALRVLLGDPGVGIASSRVRSELSRCAASQTAVRARVIEGVDRWVAQEALRPDFSKRYLSYRGDGGRIDPDFLVYTSAHRAISSLYGDVVFEIREETPRGVDLNSLNRDVYDYYHSLPLAERLNPRKFLIRSLLDRDEYVIPSHVPSADVVAADVHARLPNLTPGWAFRPTGRLQRRYVRASTSTAKWVDLLDRRGRLMARFTTSLEGLPPVRLERSREELPPEIVAEVARLRLDGRPVQIVRAAP